jgi:hypothetical protein
LSFTPVIPLSGLGGWRFLQNTLDTQRAAFESSAQNARELQYFRDNIASADTAEKLVADRTLLKIALGAFGMSEEIDKKAFIRKALEDGTEKPEALAMRLSDPRYREMSKSFGYGDEIGAQVAQPGFAEDVIAQYRIRAFEEAVGVVDESMRLALNFEREIQNRTSSTLAEEGFWFTMLGDTPMRTVLEGALGLPSQFGAIDIDQQAEVMARRAKDLIGSSDFRDLALPENREKIVRRFLIRQQIDQGPSADAPGMAALGVLQGGAGPLAIANLLISRF